MDSAFKTGFYPDDNEVVLDDEVTSELTLSRTKSPHIDFAQNLPKILVALDELRDAYVAAPDGLASWVSVAAADETEEIPHIHIPTEVYEWIYDRADELFVASNGVRIRLSDEMDNGFEISTLDTLTLDFDARGKPFSFANDAMCNAPAARAAFPRIRVALRELQAAYDASRSDASDRWESA